MKTILFVLAFAISVATTAQVTKVSLQASGLTCSMCSNAINKALRTLEFVDNIDADIKTYTFEISFKPGSDINFNRIRKKVENAGFAVSSFVAIINFNNVPEPTNKQIMIGSQALLLTNVKDSVLNGSQKIKVLDKGFVPVKEYKANPIAVIPGDVYHAALW